MATPLLATLFPLILALAHGSVDFYLNIIQALVPSLARHLDVPLSRVIILMGVVQFIANFIQPAAGWLMGKRNLAGILWAGTLLAILPAGMGLTHSFGIVAVLVILGAVGTGIFHPEGVVSLHQAAG
ncbi:MAG: hypothetical protein LBU79_03325, partial [Planctomycetota bacterium]|nr:hypothetical protein [Planctomycetota bacterium]